MTATNDYEEYLIGAVLVISAVCCFFFWMKAAIAQFKFNWKYRAFWFDFKTQWRTVPLIVFANKEILRTSALNDQEKTMVEDGWIVRKAMIKFVLSIPVIFLLAIVASIPAMFILRLMFG